MFLPQCDKPSYTLVQNNRGNYSSVGCILIFIFLGSKLEDKRVHRMLASVLWLKAALNIFMNRISIVLGSHPRLVVQINKCFGDRLRLHQKGYDRNRSLKYRLTGTT